MFSVKKIFLPMAYFFPPRPRPRVSVSPFFPVSPLLSVSVSRGTNDAFVRLAFLPGCWASF